MWLSQSYTSNLLHPFVMHEPLLWQPAGAQPPPDEQLSHPIFLYIESRLSRERLAFK